MLERYRRADRGEEVIWKKEKRTDKISWKFCGKDEMVFRFDENADKEFYMFRDYPWNMTPEEVAIFDKENPYWADFFKDRKKEDHE